MVFPPFNIGLPTWQFDPKFDIRNHIRQVTLRRGTESDLKALTSEIVSTHLDRSKPLWDLTLVRGLEGNRTGMIARIHHCLADGIAGVGIMNVLMDQSPVAVAAAAQEAGAPDAAADSRCGRAVARQLLKSYFSAVKGALTLHGEAMAIAQQMFANSAEPLADLMNVMPELAAPAERLPFNVVCHGPQKFGWTEISMAEIKALRQQLRRNGERRHPHRDGGGPSALLRTARRQGERTFGAHHDSGKCARRRQRRASWATGFTFCRSPFRWTFAIRRSCLPLCASAWNF